jgi:Flp pilus assembly secretin CpaC
VSAQPLFASEIQLASPAQNAVTTKKNVLFKGAVPNASVLKINEKVVTLDSKGRFFYDVTLNDAITTHNFTLKTLNKDFSVTTLNRRIFFSRTGQPSGISELETPTLKMFSPVNHQVSHKELILVKGIAKNASEVQVNGKAVELANSGRFFHKVKLSEPNAYHTVTVRALGESRQAGNSIEKSFKVYYSDPNKQPTGKQALFQAIESMANVPTIDTQATQKPVLNSVVKRVKPPEEKSDPIVPKTKPPVVVVTYPPDNHVTYESKVTVKGYVENTQEFYINNRVVRVNDVGQFSEVFPLEDLGRYVFNLYAAGPGSEGTTVLRKVFRAEQNETEEFDSGSNTNVSIEKRLSKRIPALTLSGTDIQDVMSILAEMGGLNIVADQSLSGLVSISLKDVTVQHALDLILNAQGLSYKIIDNTIMVASAANLDKVTRVETKVFRLNNARAADVQALVQTRLSGDESVQVSEKDNLLVVSADSKKLKTLATLIAKLDSQRVPQIILEAQFLEITQTSLKSLGISWGNAFSVGFTSSITDGQATSTLGLSLQTLLNTLQSDGKARLLAKPNIKAIDGSEAEIFIGDNIPYVEISSDTSGRIVEAVKYIESGILLNILPEINPITQEIKIEFKPEVSFVNGFGGPNNDIPIVRTRRVNTTVFVKNGKTVLIGGLFNSSDSDNSSRMPILSRVPILGYFFKTERDTKDETELVIALTPRIVDPETEEMIQLGTN